MFRSSNPALVTLQRCHVCNASRCSPFKVQSSRFNVPPRHSAWIADRLSTGQAQSSLIKHDKAKNNYFEVRFLKPGLVTLQLLHPLLLFSVPLGTSSGVRIDSRGNTERISFSRFANCTSSNGSGWICLAILPFHWILQPLTYGGK